MYMDRARRLLIALVTGGVLLSATAAQANITASSYPATVSGAAIAGTQNEFIFEGGRATTCSTQTYAGSLAAASASIELTPTYAGCTTVILGTPLPSTITPGSCKLKLVKTPVTAASLDCGPSGSYTIDIYQSGQPHTEINMVCRYLVGPQGITPVPTLSNQLNRMRAVADHTAVAGTRNVGTLTNCGKASQSIGYKYSIELQREGGGSISVD